VGRFAPTIMAGKVCPHPVAVETVDVLVAWDGTSPVGTMVRNALAWYAGAEEWLMRRALVALVASLTLAVVLGPLAQASPVISGQRAFGQVSIEPAFDDANGAQIFLLTPIHAPLPSKANSVAWAPMYLPMYPTSTTIGVLNCTPQNCDHVQVLPSDLVTALGLQSVYPTGTISTKYGSFTGGLVAGHDHLVGVAKTGGDFNIAWHVFLVLFTPKGVSDGASNTELLTLSAVNAAIAAGDAVGPIDSGIVFNCSITSEATYLNGQ
jgi:hypothetical protein